MITIFFQILPTSFKSNSTQKQKTGKDLLCGWSTLDIINRQKTDAL
jgi:hypothetical protein